MRRDPRAWCGRQRRLPVWRASWKWGGCGWQRAMPLLHGGVHCTITSARMATRGGQHDHECAVLHMRDPRRTKLGEHCSDQGPLWGGGCQASGKRQCHVLLTLCT